MGGCAWESQPLESLQTVRPRNFKFFFFLIHTLLFYYSPGRVAGSKSRFKVPHILLPIIYVFIVLFFGCFVCKQDNSTAFVFISMYRRVYPTSSALYTLQIEMIYVYITRRLFAAAIDLQSLPFFLIHSYICLLFF